MTRLPTYTMEIFLGTVLAFAIFNVIKWLVQRRFSTVPKKADDMKVHKDDSKSG